MKQPHDPFATAELPRSPADSFDTGPTAVFGSPTAPPGNTVHGSALSGDTCPAAATAGDLLAVPGYQVLREIARGGMGCVLAAHDLALSRDVALKILLPGANADRFVREAKITARLPHPGIPPVHALGTLADGSPFLAMKLVAGHTLAEEMKNADRHRLLQVFAQVCQAVGFAHSRGVIHRDLKPANVMVGEFGEVHVMDWGLAKDLAVREAPDEPLAPGALAALADSPEDRTRAGAILGTPAYMAPEQARGEAADARADVFALGGILCAILTGKPAFAGGAVMDLISRASAGDLRDAYARLEASGADADLAALARRCLAARPEDRPLDARKVAAEVDAYRAGVEARLRRAETEQAASQAKADEQRKRRRVQVVAAAAVATVLLAGVAASLWQMRRAMDAEKLAREERDDKEMQRQEADKLRVVAQDQRGRAEQARTQAEQARTQAEQARTQAEQARTQAEREKAVAQAVRDFLQGRLLRQANPYEQATAAGKAGGGARPDVTVRELLDQAAKDFGPSTIAAKLPGQPLVQAEVLETIGETYEGLREFSKAVEFVVAAHGLREKHLGPDHAVTLTSLVNLAFVHLSASRHAQAVPLLLRLLTRMESATVRSLASHAAGADDPAAAALDAVHHKLVQRADPRHFLYPAVGLGLADGALVLLQVGQALPVAQRLAQLSAKRFGRLDRRAVAADICLGFVYHILGQVRKASEIYEDGIARAEKILPAGHWGLIGGREAILMTYNTLGIKGEKKQRMQEELFQTKLSQLGPDHPSTLTTLKTLAMEQQEAGRLSDVLALLERVLEARKNTSGKGIRSFDGVLTSLSDSYQKAGKKAEALALMEGVRESASRKLGPDHRDALSAQHGLAKAYRMAGRQSEATKLLEQVRAARAKALGAEHPETLDTMHELAGAYQSTGKLSEAIKLYEQVCDADARRPGAGDREMLTTLRSLADACRQAGRQVEALRWHEKLHEATVRVLGPDHAQSLNALEDLGRVCREARRLPEAIKLHEQARDARVRTQGADHPATLTTRHNLAFTYAAAGKTAEAISLYEEVREAKVGKLGADAPETLITLENLALLYRQAGQKEKALPVLEQAADGAEKRKFQHLRSGTLVALAAQAHEEAGQFDKAVAWRRKWLAVLKARQPAFPTAYAIELEAVGRNLLRQGKGGEAEPVLREALAIREKAEPGSWRMACTRSMLGEALLSQKKNAEAEPLLLQGYADLKERQKTIPFMAKGRLAEAAERLAQLHDATGNKDEAAKLRLEHRQPKQPSPPRKIP